MSFIQTTKNEKKKKNSKKKKKKKEKIKVEMSTSSRSIVSKFEVKFRREVEKGGSFKSCS